MKKKIFSISLLLLFSSQVFSQEIDLNFPSYTPTSPEAGNLGKYGRIANNSSTGQMNYSVPIYSIPLTNGSWNIALNYNYSGLILDKDPSLTGLGWTLLAGGVVNREIRGLKDESRYGYYGVESKREYISEYLATSDMDLDVRKNFKNKLWDAEADLYTVSVSGLNFSFKLDENDNPIFLSKHVNKVVLQKDAYDRIISFTVTDSEGVVYLFDEKEYALAAVDEEMPENITDTSWMLTNVTYPNNSELNFEYYADNAHTELYTYNYSAVGAALFGTTSSGEFPDPNPQVLLHEYGEDTRESILKRKVLNKIQFPQGEVEFKTITGSDGRILLKDIEVVHTNGNEQGFNKMIHQYNLTYEGPRDLLVDITNKNELYRRFEYYQDPGQSIPPFINSTTDKALDKDRWGYYNRAGNNYGINIPNTIYISDQTPSFTNTRKGALKKIIYPTGGHTSVEYEQNQIMTTNVMGSDYYANVEMQSKLIGGPDGIGIEDPIFHTVRLETDYLDGSAPDYKEAIKTFTFEYPTVMILSHSIEGTREGSHIVMEINELEGQSSYGVYYPWDFNFPDLNQNYNTLVPDFREAITQHSNGNPTTTLNPLTPFIIPQLVEEYGPDEGPSYPDNIYKNSGGRMVLIPGTYEFKIYTTMNRNSNATAEIKFQLQKDYHIPPPEFVNINVGGIRVSSLTDCTSEAGDCYERTFDYNNDYGLSSGYLAVEPLNKMITTRRVNYPKSVESLHTNFHYSTNFYSALDPAFGSPVYYRSIKEQQIGNQDIGYQKSTFLLPGSLSGTNYPKVPNGRDLSGAKLHNKLQYNSSQELVNYSAKKYKQFIKDVNTIDGYPVSLKIYTPLYAVLDFVNFDYDATPTDPETIEVIKELYPVKTYSEVDYDYKVEKDINYELLDQEYLVTGALTEYNTSSYLPNKVTTVKNNEIPLTILNGEPLLNIEDNNFSIDIEKSITYPLDLEYPSSAESKLISQNRLSTPIKVKTVKKNEDGNNILLSTNYVEYFQWFNNIIEPKKVKSSKGTTDLKDKIVYHSYGTKGNPKEVSKKDGSKIYYVWGYSQSQPIAKIEGYTDAELLSVNSYINTAINKSNLDTDTCLGSENCKEQELRHAFINLRNAIPKAQITSYTYDPLIGVTSITDPRGRTVYYEYDEFNRLEFVKDHEGKIVNENQYYYKN